MTKKQARDIVIEILQRVPEEQRISELVNHIVQGYDSFVALFSVTQDEIQMLDTSDFYRLGYWFLLGVGLIDMDEDDANEREDLDRGYALDYPEDDDLAMRHHKYPSPFVPDDQ